ncbi:lipid-A-disaccharide synthase [Neptuniibacter sp. CAU 1671]|uniref:lipid-A-disaccharide synthase n=1 Tax=Neptuniibacter sp. CAU 1671 TaxID=3032593 RepID=UPI0023DA1E52|nr:lipid-A-disaccharide synthase [Neptuniibacter sp. CAU 1671]MDF2181776.1 lipid-A-disaccharide synthase [Neptuniibacter sp. CAU 1671]
MPQRLRIGIVAGEASGDILGAGLMQALRSQLPQIEFTGIGGELMLAEGLESRYPMERLSVMGLVEVLGRLRELLKLRKRLIRELIAEPVDLFIGIDAPDFTLKMELEIRQAGIPTVHYVSPSVWAWKPKRIYKIKRCADLLLALFPFEPACYQPTQQRMTVVGHPLAQAIEHDTSLCGVRELFQLLAAQKVVALLPGSRGSEIKYLAEPFLDTARWLQQQNPELMFLLPAATERIYQQLTTLVNEKYADLNLRIILKQSRQVMAAADAILIASGTATLEATLLGKPMVVAYRMAPLTYAIYSRMVKAKHISLPNLLAEERLVPEMLQDNVRPELLGPLLQKALNDSEYQLMLANRFAEIKAQLLLDSNQLAAAAVVALLRDKGVLNAD